MIACEWNPYLNKPSITGNEQPTDCKNEATLNVGAKASDNWHLCESCAALPEFKKYRSRKPLQALNKTHRREDMRDENEIQEIADRASSILNNGALDPHDKRTILLKSRAYDVEYVRGVLDALDWALDEDIEEAPLQD